MTSIPSGRPVLRAPGTGASIDSLTLRTPDALICAVPYLLGFVPEESAVLLWLARGRILLTQRLDLPSELPDLPAWQRAVWSHAAVVEAEELIVVLYCGRYRAVLDETVSGLLAAAGDRDLPVRDLLRSDDGRWWSLLCSDSDCCPDDGRVADPVIADQVAAEFALLGCAPLQDRRSVVRSLDPDPARVAAIEACLVEVRAAAAGLMRESLEEWRNAAVRDWEGWLTGAARRMPVDDPAADARLLVSLADIRVRDTLLWEVARMDPDRLQSVMDRMIELVRAAPAGVVGPVAACAAVAAWLAGDGARAGIAVDRAQADDPGYSLAALVGASLHVGLPPSTWREAMAGLSREECRFGRRGGLGD